MEWFLLEFLTQQQLFNLWSTTGKRDKVPDILLLDLCKPTRVSLVSTPSLVFQLGQRRDMAVSHTPPWGLVHTLLWIDHTAHCSHSSCSVSLNLLRACASFGSVLPIPSTVLSTQEKYFASVLNKWLCHRMTEGKPLRVLHAFIRSCSCCSGLWADPQVILHGQSVHHAVLQSRLMATDKPMKTPMDVCTLVPSLMI